MTAERSEKPMDNNILFSPETITVNALMHPDTDLLASDEKIYIFLGQDFSIKLVDFVPDELKDEFLDFVAEVMEEDEVSMDLSYKEGKWDSLMMLTLVMELEAEYGVSIPMESLGNVKTLSDMC